MVEILFTVLTVVLFFKYVKFMLEMWEYKRIKKQFYNRKHPAAWYPPNPKPSLFTKNKKSK
jgi:hypothetical protein